MGELLVPAWGRSGRTLRGEEERQLGRVWRGAETAPNCWPGGGLVLLRPYLYLLSAWGGGVTLRSESDSDTGLRGREAEEVGRDVDQVATTGEDRGFGSVDTPDRDLQNSSAAASQHLPSNLGVAQVTKYLFKKRKNC